MAVITISRQYGSGGDEIAKRVRDRLGYRYFDKKMMALLGPQAIAPEKLQAAASDPGQARTIVERMFSDFPVSMGDTATRHRGAASETGERLSLELVDSLIRAAARQGSVVIVGRGGQSVLRDEPGVLHLRIVAPLEARVENVSRQEGLSPDTARDLIGRRDRASAEYVRRFYQVDVADPELYDLVLNAGRVTPDGAAALIINAISLLPDRG